ncbi:hypothetical protein D3C75_1203700 [compost metagenome]
MAGRQLATQHAQQAALACTIRPEHAHDLARVQLQVEVLQYFIPTTTQVQALDLQHQLRPLISRTRKNGAPINAVTIPIGNSAGANANRATRSASSISTPPANNEAGNTTR